MIHSGNCKPKNFIFDTKPIHFYTQVNTFECVPNVLCQQRSFRYYINAY